MTTRRYILLALLVGVIVTGCAPAISPLYRDYEIREDAPTQDEIVLDRIEAGLKDAGWTLSEPVTDNIVATEDRQFRQWGLYSVHVSLEAAPIGGDYVRLMVHPYRHYFTGARSKIPYLRGSLGRSVLNDLRSSFEKQGLIAIGTRESRDKAARNGR